MSDPIGTYTFLPWLRLGVANEITAPAASARASIDVAIEIEGSAKTGTSPLVEPITRKVELYGPGDIIGVDSAQISRVEPPHWTTNFEPNYLPLVEFYDEDFPWRYTPASPDGRRLLPWLALIVLEEGDGEFKQGSSVEPRPLPFIEIVADFADVFPDASEAWAWAHAHFNAELSAPVVETNATVAATGAQHVIDSAPDTACSRLLCARKLKPKTGYHAFLIPAFESGRLAGLGHDPKPLFDDAANALTATSSSWGPYAVPANRKDPTLFPVYFRWYFRTAENGDFESLVRLLQPKVVDARVGHRDMDVTKPAPNISGINHPDLGGVLRLGGALRAPLATLDDDQRAEYDKYDLWATPYPQPFQRELAAFVNLADGYQESGPSANADAALSESVNADPDPMITPPLYGRWHARTERLLTEPDGSPVPERENWVHDLNLDPRWRVAAGMGTEVIQQNQETFMEGAWSQIGDVIEANRRIRQAQLAKAAGMQLHAKHVAAAARVSSAGLLMLTAPMKARVVSSGITVRHRLVESSMSTALTSSAARRALRPSSRVSKRLGLSSVATRSELVERANAGEVSAAPPKVAPAKILTPDDVARELAPDREFARIWDRILLVVVLFFAVQALRLGPLGWGISAALAAVARRLWRRVRRADAAKAAAERTKEENIAPAVVDRMPGSSGFRLEPNVSPETDLAARSVGSREIDNVEARRFKEALKSQYRVIDESRRLGEIPRPVPLDLSAVARDVVSGIRPELTVPRWTLSGIELPPRILDQIGESFVEVMAYPEFDTPMYEPLAKAGAELFVPNIHLVEPDSVTLLETNQRFIEAYMVGLNHEFARELLWREYPTDQRGSYFRQFWDVRKKLAAAANPEAAREIFKDIKELHRWELHKNLGDFDNRETGPVAEEELVLVIRGELLKKYPNTIISAQPAKWQTTNGVVDKSKERVLDDSVRPITPLYEARVAPDIYFFGFDLTALVARGDDTVDDKPGWFFRIEEVPGDARFGFDIEREAGTDINVWNDLAWADVVPTLVDGKPIKVADIPPRTLVEPLGDLIEKHEQWEHDRDVPLNGSLSSAELAYISLQTPVIMAIHASELLPNQESDHG